MAITHTEYANLLNWFIANKYQECANEEKRLEKIRKEFVSRYNAEAIKTMTIEEYYDKEEKDSFAIDLMVGELSKMAGIDFKNYASYGLYYRNGMYHCSKKYGQTVEEAIQHIRDDLLILLEAGKVKDYETLQTLVFAPTYRGKILYTYYPETYLCIFLEDHIDQYLKTFGISYVAGASLFDKQELLIKHKNSHPQTKDWTFFQYMIFLYTCIRKKKKEIKKEFQKTKCKDSDFSKLDENIFLEEEKQLIQELYTQEDHAFNISAYAAENGFNPFHVENQLVGLSTKILNALNIKYTVGKEIESVFNSKIIEGQETKWLVPEKLYALMHTSFTTKIEDELDEKLNKDIKETKIIQTNATYQQTLKHKQPANEHKGSVVYPRDRKVAINALNIAGFKCECDANHTTFNRKSDGLPYMEAHHLIPMAYQDDFEYSLDIEENIVSLCSHCHNEIHYGQNAKQLVEKLYNERKQLLEGKKINITLKKLLEYYK